MGMRKTRRMYDDFTRQIDIRREGYSEQNRAIKAINIDEPVDLEVSSIKVSIQRDLSAKLKGFNFELDNKFLSKVFKDDNRFTHSNITNFGFILNIRVYCKSFIQNDTTYDKVEFKVDRFITDPLTETNSIFSKRKGIETLKILKTFKVDSDEMKQMIIGKLNEQLYFITDDLRAKILTECTTVVNKYIFVTLDKYFENINHDDHTIIEHEPLEIFNIIREEYFNSGVPDTLRYYI